MKIYTYSKCSTCRDAVKWLRESNVAFDERPIRETPPTRAELRRMLAEYGGEIRRLFNTSGVDYRAQKLAEKLPTLTETAALDLLATNGNLVKRPFLIGERVALVGFNPAVWADRLGISK
ncbi:MAG TPA: arsenate reductase family protein [Opitutus sp.]|nr:arsenate reductase family protein [Opitutus sp.]